MPISNDDPNLFRPSIKSTPVVATPKTISSESNIVYPKATEVTTKNDVTITQSNNNTSGDVVTVYTTKGTINVTSIDQTINDFTSIDSGVAQIIAGENIVITSSSGNGHGIVTISTDFSPNVSTDSLSNGTSNIQVLQNGPVTISIAGVSNTVVIDGSSITTAGELVAGSANLGNSVIANYFVGDGGLLSNISNIGVLENLSVIGNANVGTLHANTASFDNDLIVNGNLVVNGNLTYINIDDITVEDPIIQLQTGPNGAPLISNTGKDVGTALNYYDTSAKVAFMGWDTSNVEIAFGRDVSISNNVVTFNELANIRSGNVITTGVIASTLSGNGALLTSITGANVTGTVANATYSVSAGSSTTANTVTDNVQPNITSVGTLSSISVSGNANVGGEASVVGNLTLGSGSGGSILGANSITSNLFIGTLVTGSQPNITAIGTLSSLSVSGNANITTINTNNITFKQFSETVINIGNISGAVAPDASMGTIYKYTLTGDITLNSITNAVAGTSMTIILKQDAVGSRLLTSSSWYWASNNRTLTTTPNAIDIVCVFYDGTDYYAALTTDFV